MVSFGDIAGRGRVDLTAGRVRYPHLRGVIGLHVSSLPARFGMRTVLVELLCMRWGVGVRWRRATRRDRSGPAWERRAERAARAR